MMRDKGDYSVFDTHQHLGALSTGGENEGNVAWKSEEDYPQRLQILDKFGIRAGAVLPASQYLRPNGVADTCAMNDMMAEYRGEYRERFPVALGTVEPLYGERHGVAEIRRIATDLRLDGVVWHHRFQGIFINDSIMHPFLRTCAEYGLPAFIHMFAESAMEAPWGLEALAEQHPDVTFVALDAFSGSTQSRYMMGIAKRCPNVLFETGVLFPLGRIIEDFVGRFGSERLLFGTDLYITPLIYLFPHVLYEILEAPTLTEEDKQNILWNNAGRLFRLEI